MGEEWRTLTFGDLRPGDVIRTDQDGPEETVRKASRPTGLVAVWIRTDLTACWRGAIDPVLVRHPRPQEDET